MYMNSFLAYLPLTISRVRIERWSQDGSLTLLLFSLTLLASASCRPR
jgi:hypothetical protein